LALVLNRGDLAQRNPVLGDGSISSARNLGGSLLVDLKSKVSFGELLLADVSERGDSEGAGGVVSDGFEVFGEDFQSVSFLVGVTEFLIVGHLELLPFLDD